MKQLINTAKNYLISFKYYANEHLFKILLQLSLLGLLTYLLASNTPPTAFISTLFNKLSRLENPWEIASTLCTLVAILVAIRIPTQIAKKENKIALFEKRMHLISLFNTTLSISQILQNKSKTKRIKVTDVFYSFITTYLYSPLDTCNIDENSLLNITSDIQASFNSDSQSDYFSKVCLKLISIYNIKAPELISSQFIFKTLFKTKNQEILSRLLSTECSIIDELYSINETSASITDLYVDQCSLLNALITDFNSLAQQFQENIQRELNLEVLIIDI